MASSSATTQNEASMSSAETPPDPDDEPGDDEAWRGAMAWLQNVAILAALALLVIGFLRARG
jgi:hypothetical protein